MFLEENRCDNQKTRNNVYYTHPNLTSRGPQPLSLIAPIKYTMIEFLDTSESVIDTIESERSFQSKIVSGKKMIYLKHSKIYLSIYLNNLFEAIKIYRAFL